MLTNCYLSHTFEVKTNSHQLNIITETSDLGSLSAQLNLEELWSTLSKCLVELGEMQDTHAVLVLQPAVEAFFQVHVSAAFGDHKERKTAQSESREGQLAHLHHEIAPLSPLPSAQTEGECKTEFTLHIECNVYLPTVDIIWENETKL